MKYNNAQILLLRFCRYHGFTDVRFTGPDRLSAVDRIGHRRHLGINLYGDILDLGTREVIAAADTSHDITETYEFPAKWKQRDKHNEDRDEE